MFENFSDKSTKAVEAAVELAERLHDQSVATGHLIYGLTLDDGVRLHHIFKDLNIDPDMFSQYVGSLQREAEMADGSKFNRHVMTVFDRARECAEQFRSKLIEPEHLAIALMSVKAGSCYEVLMEFNVDPRYVQILILENMGLEAEDAPDWF